MRDKSRYLQKRGKRYSYYRAVPRAVKSLDERYPFVRKSLKTGDFDEACARRDVLERADDELWRALEAADGEQFRQFWSVFRDFLPIIRNEFGAFNFSELNYEVPKRPDVYFRLEEMLLRVENLFEAQGMRKINT